MASFAARVADLRPYSPIEPPSEIARRLQKPESAILKLDANENLYGLPKKVREALADEQNYHIYPDPQNRQIRRLLADYTGFDPEQIIVGAGSDELLDLLFRLILNPGDKVVNFSPCFPYYEHLIQLNDACLLDYPRTADFSIAEETLEKIPWSEVKLVLLTSPNNPTGNLVEPAVLEKILAKPVWVLLDEAYFEFSQTTYQAWLQKYPNLMILRTTSKMFAMAGLRLGYGLVSREVYTRFMALKPPYSVNLAAERAFAAWLEVKTELREQLAKILQTRAWIYDKLQQLDALVVYPSSANFFLVELRKGQSPFARGVDVKKQLEQQAILVRSYSHPRLESFFRFSIGRQAGMEVFFAALEQTLAKQS